MNENIFNKSYSLIFKTFCYINRIRKIILVEFYFLHLLKQKLFL